MKPDFKYIYGPVQSWRMGNSLGIDPLSQKEKICNFDCVYCQLGKTRHFSHTRRIFIPTQEILKEIRMVPLKDIDSLTICGRGEPTLAQNLGDIVGELKKFKGPAVSVITNAALLNQEEVRWDLMRCDVVLAKLDAVDQESFDQIDRAHPYFNFEEIISSLAVFRRIFSGSLHLDIMFIEQNKSLAPRIADICRNLKADVIELNTPLRLSRARPLRPDELAEIKKYFTGLCVKTVYEVEHKAIEPWDREATQKRHGHPMKLTYDRR